MYSVSVSVKGLLHLLSVLDVLDVLNLGRLKPLLLFFLLPGVALLLTRSDGFCSHSQCVIYDAQQLHRVRVGDWVLRSGTGRESALVEQLSDSAFSHLGLVVRTQPQLLIVHATTSDDVQHPNQVIISSFDRFASPRLARRVLVVRPTFLSEAQKQQMAQSAESLLGQAFVLAPRQKPNLYCTTLLLRLLRPHVSAQNSTRLPAWQRVNAPLLRGEYLFPQAFLAVEGLETVYDSDVPVSRRFQAEGGERSRG